MQPCPNAPARPPNEAWRDAVSTFWNTVDTIGAAAGFLPLRLLLDLRRVDSRWNLAVCDSVRRLKCKREIKDAMLGALVDRFREVRSLSLDGCRAVTIEGVSYLARLGGLTELDVENTKLDAAALDAVVCIPQLSSLSLVSCQNINDADVAKLGAMTRLTSLDLRASNSLTAASLERLSEAVQTLASLRVGRSLSTPEATRHLRRFPRLTSLKVQGAADASIADVCCLTGLTALDLSHTPELPDAQLALLCCSLPRLTTLSLRGCFGISDAGLESVSQLAALTALDVGETFGITECGIVAVSRLAGLKTLRLDHLFVHDTWLVHVAKLVGLTELNLLACDRITDVGVQSLAPLTQLRTLDVSPCEQLVERSVAQRGNYDDDRERALLRCGNITDAGGAALGGTFTKLRTLKLRYCTKLSNAGLGHIARLPRLTELDLHGCENITRVGVAVLSQLRSLEWVDLRDIPKVSAEAVASLRAAIPGAEVLASSCAAVAAPPKKQCVAM